MGRPGLIRLGIASKVPGVTRVPFQARQRIELDQTLTGRS
jgi:hypothetical protein